MKQIYLFTFLVALLALPIGVAAQDEPQPEPEPQPAAETLKIDGIDIIANPEALLSLTCVKGGTVNYDADAKVLTFAGTTLEASSQYIIDSEVSGLTIMLIGPNTLNAGCLRFMADTEIKGTDGSSLIASGTCYILARDHMLTISSTYLQINCGGNPGIDNRGGTLTLNDADVIIRNANPVVFSANVTLTDCTAITTVPGGAIFDPESGTFKANGAGMSMITFSATHHHESHILSLFPQQTSYKIDAGSERDFSLPTVLTSSNWSGTLSYYSSNPNVATITSDGTLTLHGFGQTTITVTASATANYIAAAISYVISYGKKTPSMYFTKTTVEIPYTHTAYEQLPRLVYTGDGKLNYTSSDEEVLAFDHYNGTHVMGVGTTTITVYAEETELFEAATASYTCTVTAAPEQKPSEIRWIKFDGNDLYVEKGTEAQYSSDYPLAKATNGYDGRIYYKSSNPSVVSVDYYYGTLTFKSTGTVTITATAPETDYYTASSISYKINYYEPAPILIQPDMAFKMSEITLQEDDEEINDAGELLQWLTVTINNDYDGTIKYSSSNPDCVDVNEETGMLIFNKFGTATITATASATTRYLEATASYTVTYEAAPDLRPEPELAFTTEQVEVTFMADGKVKIPMLMMQYSGDAPLSFTSSNERVVSVEEDGLLYITGEEGMATITVTAPETDTWKAASTTLEIRVAEQTAVQVGQVKGQHGNDVVYDLNGRRIKRAPQRGIYITAGRKTAVR